MFVNKKFLDRKMAGYLLQIKRRLPYDQQRDFKLSSSEIAEQVFELHQTTQDEQIRKLASDFLSGLGAHWHARLAQPEGDLLGRALQQTRQQSAAMVDRLKSAVSRVNSNTDGTNPL